MSQLIVSSTIAKITGLSHDGRGIAEVNHKTVFIENALPGETVSFVYYKKHRKFDEGRSTEIIVAAPERIPALCPHFSMCGGCTLQHLSSEGQLAKKEATLLEQLQHFGKVTPESVLPKVVGPIWGYRRRARIGVRFVPKKGKVLIGFHEKRAGKIADLSTCLVLDERIGKILTELGECLFSLSIKEAIPQIEIACGDEVASLMIRHLSPFTENDLDLIRQFAKKQCLEIYLQPGNLSTVHTF